MVSAQSVTGVIFQQLRFLHEMLMKHGVPYMLQYGSEAWAIRTDDDFDSFVKRVLVKHMRTEKALTVPSGSDTLIYRIIPNVPIAPEEEVES